MDTGLIESCQRECRVVHRRLCLKRECSLLGWSSQRDLMALENRDPGSRTRLTIWIHGHGERPADALRGLEWGTLPHSALSTEFVLLGHSRLRLFGWLMRHLGWWWRVWPPVTPSPHAPNKHNGPWRPRGSPGAGWGCGRDTCYHPCSSCRAPAGGSWTIRRTIVLLAWAGQGESRHRSDRLPILAGKVMECRQHIGTDVEAGQSNLLNHGGQLGQMAVLFGEQ